MYTETQDGTCDASALQAHKLRVIRAHRLKQLKLKWRLAVYKVYTLQLKWLKLLNLLILSQFI